MLAALARRRRDAAIAAAPRDRHDQAGRRRRRGRARRWTARALWAVQTPQVFRRAALRARAGRRPTRCSRRRPTTPGWSSAPGGRVRVVEAPAREHQGHDAARPRAGCRARWRALAPSALILLESLRRAMLTDYHVHLRPDELDASADELLHGRQRRALPRGGRASAGSPSWASPSTSTASRRRSTSGSHPFWERYADDDLDAYCAFVREQTDLRLGIEADFVPGARIASRPCSRSATSTTWSARCTSSRDGAVDMDDYSVWDARSQRRARSGSATSRRSARRRAVGCSTCSPTPTSSRCGAASGRCPSGDLRRYYELAIERHRRVRHRRRGLHRRAAQARRRALPGARRSSEMCVEAGAPGRAVQRRAPPRGRRRRLRRRARAAGDQRRGELCVFEHRERAAGADRMSRTVSALAGIGYDSHRLAAGPAAGDRRRRDPERARARRPLRRRRARRTR